jgi:hypothetical protein
MIKPQIQRAVFSSKNKHFESRKNTRYEEKRPSEKNELEMKVNRLNSSYGLLADQFSYKQMPIKQMEFSGSEVTLKRLQKKQEMMELILQSRKRPWSGLKKIESS